MSFFTIAWRDGKIAAASGEVIAGYIKEPLIPQYLYSSESWFCSARSNFLKINVEMR